MTNLITRPMTWQPIETAPKKPYDRRVLVTRDSWDDPLTVEVWQLRPESLAAWINGPTHWLPWEHVPALMTRPTVSEAELEQIARTIGSYVVHDDHGGPDTKVLHDVIGGDYDEATRRVYELANLITRQRD